MDNYSSNGKRKKKRPGKYKPEQHGQIKVSSFSFGPSSLTTTVNQASYSISYFGRHWCGWNAMNSLLTTEKPGLQQSPRPFTNNRSLFSAVPSRSAAETSSVALHFHLVPSVRFFAMRPECNLQQSPSSLTTRLANGREGNPSTRPLQIRGPLHKGAVGGWEQSHRLLL